MDIKRYPLPNSPLTIDYTLDFEEQQARVFAGLGLEEYMRLPGAPRWRGNEHMLSKSEVLVLYRMNRRIDAVIEDVRIKKATKR